MAVNREPILKRCRYLGISPMVMGVAKEATFRNPDANKRKKVSEYGVQLKEKQKLKFIYGMLEKQFRHYFELAEKMEGQAGENLITLLESRLDSVVFRMGLASTRRESRQLVSHGHFNVNGKRVDIPSYLTKEGEVVSIMEKSRSLDKIKAVIEENSAHPIPKWLEVNRDAFEGKIVAAPVREDVDLDVDETLIVELYSK